MNDPPSNGALKPDTARTEVAEPPAGAKPRILLVEDDADTADMLAELLREEGYQVRIADSVRAALAIDIGTVDLLLSDMGLGDATGLDLMQQLRKKSAIKGIVLSGFGTDSDVRASREAGFSRHLVKPVSFELLFEAIAAVTTEA